MVRSNFFRSGQVALPFILIVSGIIIEITLASTIVAYFLSSSGLSERLQTRALVAARAGVHDGVMRVVRDKEYGATSKQYSFSIDRDNVSVSVTRVINGGANIYIYTIIAVGDAGGRERQIIATLSVSQTTGEARVESLVEAPLS